MEIDLSRRDFARLALGGALSTLPLLGCATSTSTGKSPDIKISLQLPGDFTDEDLTFARQLGVEYVSVPTKVGTFETFAGIRKRVTPHSLRHTFASYKAERGVSAFQLKEWLGHRKLDTTQIYVHMARQNAKKVMEATSL